MSWDVGEVADLLDTSSRDVPWLGIDSALDHESPRQGSFDPPAPVRPRDPLSFLEPRPLPSSEEIAASIVDAVATLPQDVAGVVGALAFVPPPERVPARVKRIRTELRHVHGGDHPDPTLLFLGPVDEASDPYLWRATFLGPPDTPYDEGTFHLEIQIPADYPFGPPRARMLTPIYHCNFTLSGEYHCDDTTRATWSPRRTIIDVVNSTRALMQNPDPDSPQRVWVAVRYRNHRAVHDATAREWVRDHGKTPLEWIGDS